MGRTRVLLTGATSSLVLTSQFHTLSSSSLNGQKADCLSLSLRSVPELGGGVHLQPRALWDVVGVREEVDNTRRVQGHINCGKEVNLTYGVKLSFALIGNHYMHLMLRA